MTTGVLIFAFNNEKIDYLAMANWSARNIRRHLDLPVCVVTNQPVPAHYQFDQVIQTTVEGTDTRHFHDIGQRVTWFNGNRMDAFKLSPWDRTLVLDADYVVASDSLRSVVDGEYNFVSHKTAYDVTNLYDFEDHNMFGRNQMPMWWATVMFFNRSQHAELIFDSMHMIRNNWNHYRNLFGVAHSTYRNDYALSIALGTVNGHTLDHVDIPWKLATVMHHHKLSQTDQDQYRVDFVTPGNQPRWITLNGDFHAMGKGHLGEIIANHS